MCLDGWPLGGKDAKPRGVAIAILDDEVRILNAFKCEAHVQCGAARARIESIAFPFDTTIAESKSVA